MSQFAKTHNKVLGMRLAKENGLWSKPKLPAVREMCEFFFADRDDLMIFSRKSESGTFGAATSQELVRAQKRSQQTSGDASEDEQCLLKQVQTPSGS